MIMNIGVFIDNKSIASVDCRNLVNGNPGLGGAAYSILLLCDCYKRNYPNNHVTIFATSDGLFPSVDSVCVVENMEDAIEKCNRENIDIFIIRPVINARPISDAILNLIKERKVKTITWAHNFYDSEFAKKLADNEYIVANVFVGKQQYDYYIDHDIIYKSVYIYNMYPQVEKKIRINSDGKTVTYIGSLVKSKGFHILARAWKSILKEVPDAQLYVIGSGALYSRDAKLGEFNIADAKYEKLFMPYLMDENDKLLSSVHFLGTLGTEKDDYIAQTSVGIINPSGRTETFGISALDFESQGVPVVTIAYVGFLDTVKNGVTGLLYSNKKRISDLVIRLLKDTQLNEKFGKAGIENAKRFATDIIIKDWNTLFEHVMSDEKFAVQMPTDFYGYQFKWMRVANRRFKNIMHLKKWPSAVGVETKIKKALMRK